MERFDLNNPIAPRFKSLSVKVNMSGFKKKNEGATFFEGLANKIHIKVSDACLEPPEPSAAPITKH